MATAQPTRYKTKSKLLINPAAKPSSEGICICMMAGDGGAAAAAEEEELRHGAAGDEGAQEHQPHQVTRDHT